MNTGKMGSLSGLAFRNLSYQRFKTVIIFLLLFIMTASLFFSKLLVASMDKGMQKTYERIGADLIVVPDKYVETIQNVLFEGKACTVNFSKEWVERLKKIEGVGNISYQLFIATLSSGCCDDESQLIAIDPGSDFTVHPWLAESGKTPLQDGEIIVGSALGYKEGGTVRYYNREFKVKAVLEETGMGYDSSAFITFHDAYEIAEDPMYAGFLPFSADQESVSSILIQAEEGYSLSDLKESIQSAYRQEGMSVYSSGELTGVLVKQFQAYRIYGTWFGWIFVIMAAVSIFAVYMVNIRQRYREFACMSSIGFSFGQIIAMLFDELITNALLAGISGGAVTVGIFFLFRLAIRSFVSVPLLLPSIGEILSMGFYIIILNVAVSMIAYLYAILRLRNTELALLVKEEI